MIPQVGLRPTGWLNCACFTRNSPKKMSPDIYYQPLSCVSLNKKAYLYYLPPLPSSFPSSPTSFSFPCLPPLPYSLAPFQPNYPSIPFLPPSLSREVNFSGKSTFP